MDNYNVLVVIGIILFVLVAWGLIGSSQVSELGNSCDIGINDKGSLFCWKWHRNVVGDFQDSFDNFLERGK